MQHTCLEPHRYTQCEHAPRKRHANTDILSVPYKTPCIFYREEMILPVFVLPVFVCIFCLQTYFACNCISAQDFGGLHCLTVSLVAPSQNWPQHQTNY